MAIYTSDVPRSGQPHDEQERDHRDNTDFNQEPKIRLNGFKPIFLVVVDNHSRKCQDDEHLHQLWRSQSTHCRHSVPAFCTIDDRSDGGRCNDQTYQQDQTEAIGIPAQFLQLVRIERDDRGDDARTDDVPDDLLNQEIVRSILPRRLSAVNGYDLTEIVRSISLPARNRAGNSFLDSKSFLFPF